MENQDNFLTEYRKKTELLNLIICCLAPLAALIINITLKNYSSLIPLLVLTCTVISSSYYLTFKNKKFELKATLIPIMFILATVILSYVSKGIPQFYLCIIMGLLMSMLYFDYQSLKTCIILTDIILLISLFLFYFLVNLSPSQSSTLSYDVIKIAATVFIQFILLTGVKFINKLLEELNLQKEKIQKEFKKKERLNKTTNEEFLRLSDKISDILSESENITVSLKEIEKGIETQIDSITDINC